MLSQLLLIGGLAMAGRSSECPTLDGRSGKLEGRPGQRRAALVVGVGDYAATVDGESIDIPAASTDARAFRDLLVETFGFPARNVCLLRDGQATRERFFAGYDATFGKVAKGDDVVLYFAGHGSRTPGRDQTYVLHDSRTDGVPDVTSIEIEQRMVDTYLRTPHVAVFIDASHAGGARGGPPSGVIERWVPHAADAPKERLPNNPRIAREMPDMVWLHAAPDGMPALERDGHGVFTAGLIRALRERPTADWDQIFHDVTRWTAALHSWQQPTAGGNLARRVWSPEGPTATLTVASVKGTRVELRGARQPGLSEGALLRVGEDALVRVASVDDIATRATVVGTTPPVPGGLADLAVPGRDLTAVDVSFQGPGDWVRKTRATLSEVVEVDPVLVQTVRFVERGGDYILRPGPEGTIDLVGADGVRRNRLSYGSPGQAAGAVAQTLGLYSRQAALLALSGEVPPVYPRDMFDVRMLPAEGEVDCSRTPYAPPERSVPWSEVPMCTPVKLAIRLRETPKQPLHLGIVYLAGNGNIETWPAPSQSVTLAAAGEEHVQVLGWVTPPLDTPDRILVFGTHEPVNWSRLQGRSPADQVTRGIGAGDFFVAAVAGSQTRGSFVQAGHDVPPWTASLLSVEVVADPERWTAHERETTSICRTLVDNRCAAGKGGEAKR